MIDYNEKVAPSRSDLFLSITAFDAMEKKNKKRLEVLRQKYEKTQKLISAAMAQPDDPHELEALKKQLVELQREIDELKKS